MVFIPQQTTSPGPELPLFDLTAELIANRLNTAVFIAQNPTRVVLVPRVATRSSAGASEMIDAPERPEQTFKLIQQSPSGASIEQRTADGDTERRMDYVLLGHWNAAVAIGDHWETAGVIYEVMSVIPYNGYEVRVNVEAYR